MLTVIFFQYGIVMTHYYKSSRNEIFEKITQGNNLAFSFFDIKKNSNIPNHYVCNLKFQLQTVTLMRKKYCHIHIQTVLSPLFEPKNSNVGPKIRS